MTTLARTALRSAIVLAVVAQTAVAFRTTAWSRSFRSGIDALRRGDGAAATEALLGIAASRPADPQFGAWLGDAALAALDGTPKPTDEQRERWLDAAWTGYASSVLTCPADSWSWSGLAEVALRRAEAADLTSGLDISALGARASGTLDGWRAAALGAARLATEIKPSGFQELDVLAEVYRSMGDTDSGARAYETSARMMPAPSFHAWGSTPVSPSTLYPRIVAALSAGIAAAPGYEAALLHLEVGKFAELNGDTERALAEYRASRASARNLDQRFYAAFETSRLLAAMGRLDDALTQLDDARRTGVGATAVRRLHAELRSRQGDFATACTEWLAVLREHPSDGGLRLLAAQACEASGEPELAERVLREGIGAPSESEATARALVELLVRHGRSSTAADLLRRWQRDDPAFKPGPWADAVEPSTP